MAGATDVRLWDVKTGELLHVLEGYEKYDVRVYGIAWSPDGRTFASTGKGAILLWDAETWQLRRTLEWDTAGQPPTNVVWSPDGREGRVLHSESRRDDLHLGNRVGTAAHNVKRRSTSGWGCGVVA